MLYIRSSLKQSEDLRSYSNDTAARIKTFRRWTALATDSAVRFIYISLLATSLSLVSAGAQVKAALPIDGVIGKVDSVTPSSIAIQTQNGVVSVEIQQPLTTYGQVPSDLSHVANDSYVGVPSTEQQNGTEVAEQIMIFPPELRGAAEGSVITGTATGTATHSRMTNGSVARPVSNSRMTNGTAQKGGGTTLVVHYQDGMQTISVPADVKVTEIAPEKLTLAAGDTVYVATTKQPNGTLTTDKIFLFIPGPESHN
jgi:hypothetical protein